MFRKTLNPMKHFSNIKILLVLIPFFLFTSISVQGKGIIEKRKYRHGFYIAPISSHSSLLHKLSNNSINEKGKMNNKTVLSNGNIQSNDTNILISNLDSTKIIKNDTNKKTLTSFVKPTFDNIKNLSALNIFPLVASSITSKSSLLEYNDVKSVKCTSETKYNNSGGVILLKLFIILLALLIHVIFPAIPPALDVLIALLIIIAIAAIFHLANNANTLKTN